MIVDHAHLIRLRLAEIESVREWFKPKMRVLEIGGGNGFQASVLSSWGCDVASIDLPGNAAEQERYHPVQEYDGSRIPFPDASFDVVFSSNVLEHIQPVADMLTETRRVLKGGGMAIHILPSPFWRLWTSLAHYPFLVKCVLSRLQVGSTKSQLAPVRDALRKRGIGFAVKRVLSSGAHGEYPGALSELYFFRRRRWLLLFKKTGFEPLMVSTNRLFYTGYAIFPTWPLILRRRMARVLGSACHIFVLKKTG